MSEQTITNIDEISIVLFLLNKINFNLYYNYIKKINLEPETKNFLDALQKFYKENETIESISVEEFLIYFSIKRPGLKKRESYIRFMEKLGETKINSKVIEENLNNFLEKYFASQIIECLAPVLDGVQNNKLDEVQELINEFNEVKLRLGKNEKELFVSSKLSDLLYREVYKPGLRWRLNCLNTCLGELRGASLGHVFARVDSGKTSFLVSEVTNFASQIEHDEIILWANNEEAGSKIKFRMYQAALKCTRDQIVDYPTDAEVEFDKLGGNKIRIFDEAILSVEELDQLLSEYKVRLLIIDQGDKVKFNGSNNFSTVEKLKELYIRFRELAKKYDIPIITVGQASAQAENYQWLQTSMMDFSKTGKPGELDYAIGIGKLFSDDNSGKGFLRYIHLCKNKMHNGKHGKYSVTFDTERALYTDE